MGKARDTGTGTVGVESRVLHPVDEETAVRAGATQCRYPRAHGLAGSLRHGTRVIATALHVGLRLTVTCTGVELVDPVRRCGVVGYGRLSSQHVCIT